jgi:hypothetical protein
MPFNLKMRFGKTIDINKLQAKVALALRFERRYGPAAIKELR